MQNSQTVMKSPVMLVDDCEIDNYINNKMLSQYNFAHNIMIYTNPLKALDYLRATGKQEEYSELLPGFIFLDLNMPLMNGHEFLEEFGRLPENVRQRCKIVVLSSSADPLDVSRVYRSPSVVAYLSKPLIKSNIDDLVAVVAELKAA